VSGWISAKERLPQNGVDVAVAVQCYPGRTRVIVAFARNVKPGANPWRDSNSFQCITAPISHWHPLPEPPDAT
jgi:hypothetical protein